MIIEDTWGISKQQEENKGTEVAERMITGVMKGDKE